MPTTPQWEQVDEGWGRAAADFASLSEPSNSREYVALHQALEVRAGDHVLDLACGSGLALELAAARGATVAGIDASPRLVAIARDRCPDGDVRAGDMNALPWPDASFDVVTSFRGIWGTTPDAVAEARRVLRPGGRLGLTVWGHIRASPGAWALSPLALATAPKVANQAAMVALGRPGVGEALLAEQGFEAIERHVIPQAWEFADPETYARALASTGPAYEAMQAIGEQAFLDHCVALAAQRVREGLPLRAEIAVVGYVARRPAAEVPGAGFLTVPETTPERQGAYDEDLAEGGFVTNGSKLWAQLPGVQDDLFDLMGRVVAAGELSFRQRGILVTACASELGDSYCSLAWGMKLARDNGAELAAAVLSGDVAGLGGQEQALATWARQVARDPNATTAADVHALRDAGFDDQQIFAITTFVALRLAFSTVNDALGASPDLALLAKVPEQVRDVVTWGRPAR